MNFSVIRLTRKELKMLKQSSEREIYLSDAPRLRKFNLIEDVCEHIPGYKPESTGRATISDLGRDYLIYHASETRRTFILPIVVSALTALAIDGLQLLLPMIQQLLSKIPA